MDDLKEATARKCPKCGETIKYEAQICRYCQTDLSEEHAKEKARITELISSSYNLPDLAKELNILPRAVKNVLVFHFGMDTIMKVRNSLAADGIQITTKPTKKTNFKPMLYIVGIVVVLLLGSGIAQRCERQARSDEEARLEAEDKAAEEARRDSLEKYQQWFAALPAVQRDSIRRIEREAEAAPLLKRINNELDDLEKYARTDLDVEIEDTDILVKGALLLAWQDIYNDIKQNRELSPELDRKVAAYEKLLPQVLRRQFPVVREAMVKNWKRKMWEHDIEVLGRGPGTTTVRFVGGIFANNASIKEFQSKISEDLTSMRFKRAEYLWYQYDDEYTYYTIQSLKDSEIR